MATSPAPPSGEGVSPDRLLLLNRATLVIDLVRAAAHELNNALLLIGGSVELLGTRADLPADVHARLDKILAQTDRSGQILRHVSAMARGERTGGTWVDAAQVATECVMQRRHQAMRLGLSVSLETAPPGTCVVAVPGVHLQQMVLNLLLNAERAAARSAAPEIHIRVARDGGWVEIVVADNGPGLDPPLEPHDIFEPFRSSGPPHEAAGLGLTAVRILADWYGGAAEYARAADRSHLVVRLPAAS